MNHTKLVLQNAYGVRDVLSGDMTVELVKASSSPPQQKIASYTMIGARVCVISAVILV